MALRRVEVGGSSAASSEDAPTEPTNDSIRVRIPLPPRPQARSEQKLITFIKIVPLIFFGLAFICYMTSEESKSPLTIDFELGTSLLKKDPSMYSSVSAFEVGMKYASAITKCSDKLNECAQTEVGVGVQGMEKLDKTTATGDEVKEETKLHAANFKQCVKKHIKCVQVEAAEWMLFNRAEWKDES